MSKTIQINRFDGGILKDIRERSFNGFRITEHFDTSFPNKLIPYRSSEADEIKAMDIVKFLQVNSEFFGLGVDSGSSKVGIKSKTGDFIISNWQDVAVSGSGSRSEDIFFHYKNYIYGWRDTNALWRFGDLTSSPTITESYQTITWTNVAQPVLHPADDIAYFFQDNVVHKLNNTSWTSSVLTLPSNLIIVDAEPFGNYLAIACKPVRAELANRSVVYLWDRDSSLTTISQKIDWGEGDLLWIANIGGNLIGISNVFTNLGIGIKKGEIQIRVGVDNKAHLVNRLRLDSTMAVPSKGNKVVTNDRLYFPGKYTIDGITREGIWSVDRFGRITLEIVEEDINTNGIQGIFKLGNFWWVAHSADGSVNRTDDQDNLTFTSIYESAINPNMELKDMLKEKQLMAVQVSFEALPTAGQVVFKYRVDSTTAWSSVTAIITEATDGAVKIELAKAFDKGREYEFRIESTGGAVITGFKYKYEIIETQI